MAELSNPASAESDTSSDTSSAFVNRVVLRNYRSIAACDVKLGPLVFLVGPNGSGKSNFVDALHFVSDAVRDSLDHALRDRGGIKEVRRRSQGHPTHFGIRVEFEVRSGASGHYAFEIAARTGGAFAVKKEECYISLPDRESADYYEVAEGTVKKSTLPSPPAAMEDRLYLVNVSGFAPFRVLYDTLTQMGFYNLNPDVLRDLQTPDPGNLLTRDGSNVASVFNRISSNNPALRKRMVEYLSKVVPGISNVSHKDVGPRETLEFRQAVRGNEHPWRFLASNMSDGTIRTFGVLVALFQQTAKNAPVSLVGIEEPEIALHPAAAQVLMDSIRDASERTQVLVTSHSPDLLDSDALSDEIILAVLSEEGDTKVGRLERAGREALREHLYTAGELLRMNQLVPDESARDLGTEQLNLFGSNAAHS
jgi:predicted ATPase